MKDIKLYSTQDVENLKEKINVYKTALTNLREDATIEDLLKKQEQLNLFKTQLTQLVELTQGTADSQEPKIEEPEEQVQKISMQIHLLNQTFEEMNREISSLIKKEIRTNTDQKTDPSENRSNSVRFPSIANLEERPTDLNEGFFSSTGSPSYKQLQKFAGPALIPFKDNFAEMPIPNESNQVIPQEERHFNQHYFQSIGTQPSEIYNGLYKNIAKTASFHFKNDSYVQEIPIQAVVNIENQPTFAINENTHTMPQQVGKAVANLPTSQEISLAETTQLDVADDEEAAQPVIKEEQLPQDGVETELQHAFQPLDQNEVQNEILVDTKIQEEMLKCMDSPDMSNELVSNQELAMEQDDTPVVVIEDLTVQVEGSENGDSPDTSQEVVSNQEPALAQDDIPVVVIEDLTVHVEGSENGDSPDTSHELVGNFEQTIEQIDVPVEEILITTNQVEASKSVDSSTDSIPNQNILSEHVLAVMDPTILEEDLLYPSRNEVIESPLTPFEPIEWNITPPPSYESKKVGSDIVNSHIDNPPELPSQNQPTEPIEVHQETCTDCVTQKQELDSKVLYTPKSGTAPSQNLSPEQLVEHIKNSIVPAIKAEGPHSVGSDVTNDAGNSGQNHSLAQIDKPLQTTMETPYQEGVAKNEALQDGTSDEMDIENAPPTKTKKEGFSAFFNFFKRWG